MKKFYYDLITGIYIARKSNLLRKMKITTLLLLISIVQIFAIESYSQTKQLSINCRNKTILDILEKIEDQSEFFFMYDASIIDVNQKKSINCEDQPITTILDQLLDETEITYKVSDRQIVLTKAHKIKNEQGQKVSGKVVDGNGLPLPGVTVMVKETTIGTVTNADGEYSLSDIPDNAILRFSFVGMKTQEIVVDGKNSIDVIMEDEAIGLDEVIAIGYGTTKRKDFTGSATSIKLEDSPVALATNMNALETLKGNVSGLDIGYTNSAGGTPSMQIRGQNSISGSNDPLIVVDGTIFLGDLNSINTNDIASVDVLKDATTAAAYGSRSANGVIMITTKKGLKGKPVIHLNMTGTGQSWHLKPELMNGEQWLDAVAAANGYSDYSFITPQEQENIDAGKEYRWLDEISRVGLLQDYQIGVSGAAEKMNYYLSTSYTDNQGCIIGDDYNRITVLGKINTDITDWLQIGLDAAYTNMDYGGISADVLNATILSPYGMKYRPNGELEGTPDGSRGHANPLWGVDDESKVENIDYRNNIRANAFLVVKIPWVKGLSYRLSYAGNLNYRKSGSFYHESYYFANGSYDDDTRYSVETQSTFLSTANGSITNIKTVSYVIDNILNYKKDFNKHSIDLTAVATRDYKKYESQYMYGVDFQENGNTTLGINGLHYAATQTITLNNYKLTNVGYFGRGSYSYDDKYYLTASYRHDGASVFGSEKKWGDFMAVGAAWRVTQESFISDTEWLDDLKIKLSWGRNGNQGLTQYSTLSKVSNGQTGGVYYTFGNSGEASYGINQTSIGNSELGWETTEAWNTGFESVSFNHRLFFDIDIYFSKTYDQIFKRTIPVMSGFTSMYASMGEVKNTGFEATVRNVNIRNKNLEWSTGITFWLNRNKLVHLYEEDLDGDGKEDDDIASGLFIGESIHCIYGYKQDGIVQTDDTEYIANNGVEAGTPKYVDLTGEGVINEEDRTIVGSTAPNFKLNLTNTLQYKNFELYVMIAGTFGGNNYFQKENAAAYITGMGMFSSNGLYIPYWTEDNPSNVYPRASFTDDDYFLGLQSRAYVRLQDVTLSYTFNQPWVKSAGINNFKLFLTGKNLATLTNWEGGDPESGSTVLSGTFPIMTSVSLGLNLSF